MDVNNKLPGFGAAFGRRSFLLASAAGACAAAVGLSPVSAADGQGVGAVGSAGISFGFPRGASDAAPLHVTLVAPSDLPREAPVREFTLYARELDAAGMVTGKPAVRPVVLGEGGARVQPVREAGGVFSFALPQSLGPGDSATIPLAWEAGRAAPVGGSAAVLGVPLAGVGSSSPAAGLGPRVQVFGSLVVRGEREEFQQFLTEERTYLGLGAFGL